MTLKKFFINNRVAGQPNKVCVKSLHVRNLNVNKLKVCSSLAPGSHRKFLLLEWLPSEDPAGTVLLLLTLFFGKLPDSRSVKEYESR